MSVPIGSGINSKLEASADRGAEFTGMTRSPSIKRLKFKLLQQSIPPR
jgi:hypothetical protein